MGSSQTFQEVNVKVPVDRIAEFYAMYGRWLAEEGTDDPAQASATGPAQLPWNPARDRDRRAGVIQRRVRAAEGNTGVEQTTGE